MNRFFCLLLCGMALLGFNGCGTDETGSNKKISADVSGKGKSSEEDIKMFVLPTPLQVGTMLRLNNITPETKQLSPPVVSEPYSDNYQRALNLGIYLVDLGYCTMFEQRQTALDYVKSLQSISNEMGITSALDPGMLQRFQDNTQQRDSLSRIILETYNEAHEYFKRNSRVDQGFFIMAGCYVEGLYLVLNNPTLENNQQLKNLVGQHKLYLDNMVELIQYFKINDHTLSLYTKLAQLRKDFSPVKVVVTEEGKQGQIYCVMNPSQIAMLKEKVSDLRRSFINS